MVTEFKFPDVGEGVTEGTLIAWLVEEGDEVEEDESLAEVETDKAVVEIPAPESATILELHAEEGEVITVGEVLVTLGEEGEDAGASSESDAETVEEEHEESTSVVGQLDEPEAAPAAEETNAAATGKVLAAPSTRKLAREEGVDITAVNGTGPGGRITRQDVVQAAEGEAPAEPEASGEKVLATPAVRRYAKEQGLDINTVNGTGPGGRVTKGDVDQATSGGGEPAAETGGETPPMPQGGNARLSGRTVWSAEDHNFEQYGEVEREEMSRTRRAIAEHMEKSVNVAPHVTATDDADVTALWNVRKREKEVAAEKDVHLTFMPFIIKACISALRDYPLMNASLDEQTQEIVKKKYYNIGMAVATDHGLLVPVIKNADRKSILRLAQDSNELAEKARNREIALDEMQGGTFTITNYGSIGGRYGTPILNYPEVGILGVGTIRKEPVAMDNRIKVRRIMPLSLTFDHRVIDGAYAAQFMNEVVKHLEDPDLLLIDE